MNMTSSNDSSDDWVKVIVHRGTHQIGGCCTEISTPSTRILIDFGANLESSDSSRLEVDGINNSKKICDGILISHYHGDHIGELVENHQNVPVYMTEKAIEIQKLYQKHSHGSHMRGVSFYRMKRMRPDVLLTIGDIKVLPIESEHSAFESLMFYIEANGKRILHTGDFRMHGLHWEEVQRKLDQLPPLDLVITEGTTLSRTGEQNWTEEKVQKELRSILQTYKYCFFLASSSNISRLETFATSIPKGKYFLMDEFQKEVLQTTGKQAFVKACTYGKNLKLEKYGFGMIVRASQPFIKLIETYLSSNPKETCFIYSMWFGYQEKEEIQALCRLPFQHRYTIHSSGHVVLEDLDSLLNRLNPKKIVMIHTEESEFHIKLKNRIVSLNDKEELFL